MFNINRLTNSRRARTKIQVQKLDQHFEIRFSVFAEKTIFYELKQEVQESVTEWVVRVQNGTKNCKFSAAVLGTALRDKFVIVLQTDIIKTRYLYQKDYEALHADDAVEAATLLEAATTVPRTFKDTGRNVRVKTEPEIHRLRRSR